MTGLRFQIMVARPGFWAPGFLRWNASAIGSFYVVWSRATLGGA